MSNWADAVGVLAPVLFAAVIVFGVVGGSIVQTLIKRVLPLLETMAKDRGQLSAREAHELREAIGELRHRLASLEDSSRDVERLQEDVAFLQKLLEARAPTTPTAPR